MGNLKDLDQIEDDVSYMQRGPRLATTEGLSDHRRAAARKEQLRRRWLAAEQLAILILSSLAIGLLALGATDGVKLAGSIAGLAAAPFCIRSTWVNRQWGLCLLAWWFGLVYVFTLGMYS